MEILDGGSDADICNETELTRFSKMLQDAQKAALAKKKAKGFKRKKFDGHSASTVYRQKCVRDNLAAMGYLPVPKFMKQMEAQKKERRTTLTFEESEESSDDNVTIVSQVRSNEPSTSEGACHQVVCRPAMSEGCCWVAHSTSEGARCQVAQGPAMSEGCCRAMHSTSEGACCQVVQEPATSGGCCQVAHGTFEGAHCQVAQGPDGCCRVAHSTSKGARCQFAEGPDTSEGCCRVAHSTSEGARHRVAQGPPTSEGCSRVTHSTFEGARCQVAEALPEEEEESGSEDESTGNANENRDVANKNGTHLRPHHYPPIPVLGVDGICRSVSRHKQRWDAPGGHVLRGSPVPGVDGTIPHPI